MIGQLFARVCSILNGKSKYARLSRDRLVEKYANYECLLELHTELGSSPTQTARIEEQLRAIQTEWRSRGYSINELEASVSLARYSADVPKRESK